jgi:hypothetical protein
MDSRVGSAVAWPGVAPAQQDGLVRRVGLLMYGGEDDPDPKARLSTFT